MIAVRFRVVFARFRGVMHGVKVVAMRQVRLVPGLLMLLGAMMFRRTAMMFGSSLVMLGGLLVMLGQFGLIHLHSSVRAAGECPLAGCDTGK